MGKRKSSVPVGLDPTRYLKERGGKWHYVRRVPAHAAHLDSRGVIQLSLKTSSLDVAKLRRDAQERADDLYWQGMASSEDAEKAAALYQAACSRVRLLGFEYRAEALIDDPLEMLKRIEVAARQLPRDAAAVVGLVDEPRLTVRQANKVYMEEIAVGETKGMSETQKRKWKEQRNFAAENFIEIIENKILLDITRADALRYHKHWLDRVMGKSGEKAISGNTANRAFGNMRKFFREYVAHLGLDLKNPFDDLSFPDRKGQRQKIPPFETDFIRDKLMKIGALEGLNNEALAIFLVLVETGCRPSEVCNLRPEDIHVDADVPFISVHYQDERVIKTDSSVRDIPLIGVALAVMKRYPKGFPRYRDKEYAFSATVMKRLRKKKLLPSSKHRVYSLRHSMEKRMLEAGLDYEFRKRILGHSVDREEYGDGGSMAWRREQLLKIALPFEAGIVP